MKNLLVPIGVILLILGAWITVPSVMPLAFRPRQSAAPSAFPEQPPESASPTQTVQIIAQNLEVPWELAFLPDGDILVTERPGNLLRIGTESKTISQIKGVKHIGEGGLLGLALHPDFQANHFLYLYSTTEGTSGITNRVERYTLTNDTLSEPTLIIGNIKGSANHDGGRIAFGPDGKLYITTGDAQNESLAQNRPSPNGKILRLNDDGSIPSDNPFGTAVYSYGHRNPQGLAWDDAGRMWSTEHGPSGLQTGYDEVNRISKGANYGWPVIRGTETRDGMVPPVIQSGKDDTWAPSGLAYMNGSLYFSGLRGESLYKAVLHADGSLDQPVALFSGTYGRLRAVVAGPDGDIYVTTSNRDGRGTQHPNDDKLLRIPNSLLK